MTDGTSPGLYVHVPFCRSKCPYCAFYSATAGGRESGWREALHLEALEQQAGWSTFDTLYVGGGTPSQLPDGVMAQLVGLLEELFDITADAERTVEVNPADVTPERSRRYLALGFNRVSIGVQSFCDDELRWLGRRHDGRQAEYAVRTLRDAGFAELGIDLVQSLPGQSIETRLWSLERALACEPDHISCYELTVEPGTPLGERVAAAECALPDGDMAAEGYLSVAERLRADGWDHYEVSNFARCRESRSRHNGKYWRHVPYLGLGPAAHSFRGRERWSNVRSVDTYQCLLNAGQSVRVLHEQLDGTQLQLERVMLGLRTAEGVDASEVEHRHDGSALLEQLASQRLITRCGGRVVPTAQGFLVADALARRLLFGTAAASST